MSSPQCGTLKPLGSLIFGAMASMSAAAARFPLSNAAIGDEAEEVAARMLAGELQTAVKSGLPSHLQLSWCIVQP